MTKQSRESYDTASLISLDEARQRVGGLYPLQSENVAVADCVGRITAAEVTAVSDCPSGDSSLKDGFAVVSADIVHASVDHPVTLQVSGTLTAGDTHSSTIVTPGSCVRIMTGAVVPSGADAVLSAEFAEVNGSRATIFTDAHPGRNILCRGHDVQQGRVIIPSDTRLRPGHAGLLAAAGVSRVTVYRQPRVVVIATGSELVVPGQPIGPGKVAASNLVTLQAVLQDCGIAADTVIIHDDLQNLQQQMEPLLQEYDVVLTCGGVLDGDKDLTMQAMDLLGVDPVFRRVRVGPGKGICFGRSGNTLVFNLPGGPPSNHVGFLLLALPGIKSLSGYRNQFSRAYTAELTTALHGQAGWTDINYGVLQRVNDTLEVTPVAMNSRLMGIAAADCLIELPEHQPSAAAGEFVRIWKIR